MEPSELEKAVAEVCGALNAAHARLVTLVAEALASDAWHGWAIHSPAQWVAWQTGLSPARAAQIVRVASRRDELPVTMAAFTSGALAIDQVAVVAARVPPDYEASACQLAASATVAQLRRVVNDYPFDPEESSPPERSERCSFHADDQGRFHLHAEGDVVGGATIDAALHEAKDALFLGGEPDPTWWDALVEIAERSLAGVRGKARRDRFRVLLHVDVTDPEATVARFTNGVSVPSSVRDRLLCAGEVQPVWVRDSVPVGVGRTIRVVPERLRRVVVHRDHGQCQVPGCRRRRVEIHHVRHWNQQGPTETWNLLSLCPRHHRLHHQGELGIHGDADRRETLEFTDAGGRRLMPCGRPALAPAEPIVPTVRYEHPTGERLRRHWITLDPRPG